MLHWVFSPMRKDLQTCAMQAIFATPSHSELFPASMPHEKNSRVVAAKATNAHHLIRHLDFHVFELALGIFKLDVGCFQRLG